jgi:lysophospholipase L1-like esterase
MGVVAIGDSLVATDESWAHWLSRVMGLPLRNLAVGGSQSKDVVGQLPRLGDEKYAVACLTVGTNDILFDWDAERFADNLATIVAAARASAELVVTPTISLALAGFPGSGAAFRRGARQANAILEGSGALVFSGSDLRGPRTMSPDRIHPTVTGQLILADRAAEALGVTPLPSTLAEDAGPTGWQDYYGIGVREASRRMVKRALGRRLF